MLGLCSLSLAEPKPKAKAQALDYYGEYGEGDYNYADYGEAGDYSYGQGEYSVQGELEDGRNCFWHWNGQFSPTFPANTGKDDFKFDASLPL